LKIFEEDEYYVKLRDRYPFWLVNMWLGIRTSSLFFFKLFWYGREAVQIELNKEAAKGIQIATQLEKERRRKEEKDGSRNSIDS